MHPFYILWCILCFVECSYCWQLPDFCVGVPSPIWNREGSGSDPHSSQSKESWGGTWFILPLLWCICLRRRSHGNIFYFIANVDSKKSFVEVPFKGTSTLFSRGLLCELLASFFSSQYGFFLYEIGIISGCACQVAYLNAHYTWWMGDAAFSL